MNEITLEVLKEPLLESYSGGGLKEIAALVTEDGIRIGTIDNYLQLGYKPTRYPEVPGIVTTKDHYPTIEQAFKAGKELNIFKRIVETPMIISKTAAEVLKLLEDVGHAASVVTKINNEERNILNNGVLYLAGKHPIHGNNNKQNADIALEEIQKAGSWFRIHSQIFDWATGEYKIVD
jgi:hypothetical protein